MNLKSYSVLLSFLISFGLGACSGEAPSDLVLTNSDLQVAKRVEIHRVTPAQGAMPGDTVTVSGRNFDYAMSFHIGGQPCGGVRYRSLDTVTCTLSNHVRGGLTHAQAYKGGVEVARADNIIRILDFKIDNVSPGFGLTDGTSLVRINGKKIPRGVVIQLGGIPCTVPVDGYISPEQVYCRPGAGTVGIVSLLAIEGSKRFEMQNAFEYVPDTLTVFSRYERPDTHLPHGAGNCSSEAEVWVRSFLHRISTPGGNHWPNHLTGPCGENIDITNSDSTQYARTIDAVEVSQPQIRGQNFHVGTIFDTAALQLFDPLAHVHPTSIDNIRSNPNDPFVTLNLHQARALLEQVNDEIINMAASDGTIRFLRVIHPLDLQERALLPGQLVSIKKILSKVYTIINDQDMVDGGFYRHPIARRIGFDATQTHPQGIYLKYFLGVQQNFVFRNTHLVNQAIEIHNNIFNDVFYQRRLQRVTTYGELAGNYITILEAIANNGALAGATEADFISDLASIASEFNDSNDGVGARTGFILNNVYLYVAKQFRVITDRVFWHFGCRCTGFY